MKGIQGFSSEAVQQTVSDQIATYLLPCSCGREIPIEPRQAGGTVRCECGQTCTVPTMRAVQSLRPASASSTTPTGTKPAWGNPQRFLVAGLVVCLLAVIAAAILYRQFPTKFAGFPSPEEVRQHIKGLSPVATIQYFNARIQPGIEIPEPPEYQSKRNMVYVGMAISAGVAAIGLFLAGIGIAGVVRRR